MDQRRTLAFIFCTVTLDVLAFGLMIPVLPRIILEFMGGDTAGAARVVGVFSTVWAAMQFISSPVLGARRSPMPAPIATPTPMPTNAGRIQSAQVFRLKGRTSRNQC